MNPLEEWLPIPGYTGYEVSNQGAVRTYRRQNGRLPFIDVPRPLKSLPMKDKLYLRVVLIDDGGKRNDHKVHHLVLFAFIGSRPSSNHDGCHKDGNARNNFLSNLYWGTKQENADDRIAHGTQVRGISSGMSKLTDSQVSEIKAALPTWTKGTGRYFAQKFGVGDTAISQIKHGRTWAHL